ncbi:hypothetical protein Bca4012_064348 [Brassica carinata]
MGSSVVLGGLAVFPASPCQRDSCAGSVTILTVNDIVAVEQDPALSVHFTVIPDAERLMLVDEAEHSGDRSFCPKLEVRDAGQEEKGCPILVHQRNLRPRKAVPVEVEEVSSSGNSEEGDPPCSERCTHENLKRWMSERFEKLENRFEELRTVDTRKNNPASSQRETGHQNESGIGVTTPFFRNASLQETRTPRPREDDQPKANESDNGRLPRPGENKGDQQQETQSNVIVLYRDVLDVEPESYVLPPEYEVGSPVAWEKTNPNCYRSVGSVRSFHPSWNGRPSSKSKETSEPKGGEGAQQQENELVTGRTPPPVENDAAQVMERVPTTVERTVRRIMTVDPKSGETVEKVPSPMADVKAILKEIDSEFPATEEDERYDSCKDDMSTDSQIQENRGNQVSEPEADSDVVASGGKRHHMRSSKITGVYTPEPRVKKFFKSEEKHEYKPIAKTSRAQYKKFSEILRENPVPTFKISTGHSVSNGFFLEIGEPKKWLSDEVLLSSASS